MTDKERKVASIGLGGGLDELNATLTYFAGKEAGHNVILGASRTSSLERLLGHVPFAECGAWVTPQTTIQSKGRYPTPFIAKSLGENVLYFSRKVGEETSVEGLRDAINQAIIQYGFTDLIFVDGGGDSLVLREVDAHEDGEHLNPFLGGDAEVLEALAQVEGANIYLGVISVGLDINVPSFHQNIALLHQRGAYFGRINVRTGEQDGFTLGDLLDFGTSPPEDYFELAKRILVFEEQDIGQSNKWISYTGVVTYRAMNGEFGPCTTHASWEPTLPDGSKGIIIKPEHCWMYFVDPREIHPLKLELNPSYQTP
jgi:hypothetical protein